MGWSRGILANERAFPLVASSSGRYLQDSLGLPFFSLVKRADSLIEDLTLAQAAAQLDAFPQFSVWLVQLLSKFPLDGGTIANAAGVFPFSGTLGGGEFDITTPNAAYFAHAKAFVDAAALRGKAVWLRPFYPGHSIIGTSDSENGFSDEVVANPDGACTTYGAMLGTIFHDCPNLSWVYSGDNADPTILQRQAAMRTGIRSTDRAGRLEGVHFYSGSTSNNLSEGGVAGWSDTLVTVYTLRDVPLGSFSPYPEARTLAAYAANSSGPPIWDVEPMGNNHPPGFEAGATDGQEYRAIAWRSYLSGSIGFTHLLQCDFANVYDDNVGQQDLAHLATFFRSVAWHSLAPNTGSGLVTAGGGTVSTAGYKPRAMTPDGTLGIVYASDGTTVTVDLTLMAGSGTVTARWFDPTSGQFTNATGSPIAQASHAFVASSEVGTNDAGGTDWVLVLERAA